MAETSEQYSLGELLSWLKTIEKLAADCYATNASKFVADTEFSTFLARAAKEEEEHLALLKKAEAVLDENLSAQPCMKLDTATRKKVEAPFRRVLKLMAEGLLTKDEMVSTIAKTEICEWNEIFLYVINVIMASDSSFQQAFAEIETHRKEIEEYIASLRGGRTLLEESGWFAPAGKQRVLVVEDDFGVANLLKALIGNRSSVVLARDGQEGLSYLRKELFDAVIADVEMPNVNGIEMYMEAANIDADQANRFIFFTGTQKPEHLLFLNTEDVIVVPKLSPMNSIPDAVDTVIRRNRGATSH